MVPRLVQLRGAEARLAPGEATTHRSGHCSLL